MFEDMYVALCSFAARWLGDDETCKDVAQDALAAYWERREDFEALHQVKGFLYTSARNACLNVLRHERVREACAEELARELEAEGEWEERVVEEETYAAVRRAVAGLPPRMRQVVEGMMAGRRNAELAEEMGVEVGTVKALKQTAYRRLRGVLEGSLHVLFFM